MVVGELLDPSIDLRTCEPGELIEPPYELTLNGALREVWTCAFHTANRLVTSKPFAQRLGFTDQILPFDMMLFFAAAMSHADDAIVQVGFRNARYLTPAYCGDTLKKSFRVKALRLSHTMPDMKVVAFECVLKNQRGETVFVVDKTMLFPLHKRTTGAAAVPREFDLGDSEATSRSENMLRKNIVNSAEHFGALSGTLRQLRAGQLILHSACRPLTRTQSMQLACMGRVVHDRHFNALRYQDEAEEGERLYVPGSLVLALVNSLAGRELHEILFQTQHAVSFTAPLHPEEVVTAVSFVRSRSESISGELEKLELVTLGIKNVGDARRLLDKKIPTALFEADHPLKTAELKDLLAPHASELPFDPNQIVLQSHRSIYRQAPKNEPFLL